MSQLNPLNDITRTYLDTVAKINQKEEETEIKRWEGELNLQMKTQASLAKEEKAESSEKEEEDRKKDDDLAGAPNKNGKKKKVKRWWDDDGDGKGYEDHEVKKEDAQYGYDSKGRSKNPADVEKRKRKEDKLFGAPIKEQKMKQARKNVGADTCWDGYEAKGTKKKGGKLVPNCVKKESFSNWRNDLKEIVSAEPMTDVESEKEVTEKKGIKNKVIINPKMSEAVAEIGGQVISETEVDFQEQKDTPDQVKAVIAFDKARKGTRDATYDSMHGKKKQAKKERDYAKWQRDKGAEDAQKSGHRWKHAKGSTREKEGKKSETHAYIKDSFAVEGYGKKKKKHNCASKVKHEEFGIGNCIKGMHTIDENNRVTHYDVEFSKYIVENCPVEELQILEQQMHEHVIYKEGVVSKEVKALQKANKTMKDKDVVKADKIDTPNYKGNKFGVKEAKDWIQGAVKRPGAFTRKAKAAGQSVQQFAKTVDDNPSKYSTRTKRQANLAQTFASMKKEDVQELFYTLVENHEDA